ncbi:MAG: ATP-binding protein [Candidatus Micrarchaeota archaeon]
MKKKFTLVPVYGDKFVGRKDIIRELKMEISDSQSHIGFCIHGRRRVGKTSILKELEFELSKEKKIVIAYISLYEMADLSLKTFKEQLSIKILETFRQKRILPFEYAVDVLIKSPREVIESTLSKIKVSAELSEELKFFLEFKKENEENQTESVKKAFNFGEMLAKSAGVKFVLVLDEFPEILKIENGLQVVKIFRTLYENQQNTAIIISGSEQKTLEAVALGETSPFYKQLILKKIHPFSFEETTEFLRKYCVKLPNEDIKKLYELTEGIPFYLQYVGRSVTLSSNIDNAIDEFIREEGNVFFTEEFKKLSEKERIIVAAIANGARTPTEISANSGEAVTSVSAYLISLREKEVVKKIEKATYILLDRLFSLWLKKRFS